MNRRIITLLLVVALAVAVVASPLGAAAQPSGKVYRIGYLSTGRSHYAGSPLRQGFTQDLRDLGYVEGKNLEIEWRGTEGRPDRAPALAAELVRLNVDVIVSTSDATHGAAKRATTTIPIVMLISRDPVRDGLVASLARPGGNVTGLSSVLIDLNLKQLELLHEAVPGSSRVGLLLGSTGELPKEFAASARRGMEDAARRLGLTLLSFAVRRPEDLEAVFAAMAEERLDALRVGFDPFTWRHRERIMALATETGISTMTGSRQFVQAGGLMSYGISMRDVWRRGAHYVDRILKGANPADLPVEQPTKFELVINVKTAKALGLTIPESVLVRADEVIE